ncbi:unnamed protein product [marine sediment metagenome]|uniref:Uncharacterized protein n=1 Tax=marine sediment metagenome TaxID=412755 RepID=X0W519_9ZZZZ
MEDKTTSENTKDIDKSFWFDESPYHKLEMRRKTISLGWDLE